MTAVLQVSTVLDHVKNSNKICGSQKRYTKMQAIEKSTYSICERTTCMHEKGAQLQKLSVINARRQSIHFSSQCHLRQASVITEMKDSYKEDQFLGAVASYSLTHGTSKLR